MTSLGVRLTDGLYNSLLYPLLAGGGALIGYAYATLAQLPASQVAKAWAVWLAAETVILTLGSAFSKTEAGRSMIRGTLLTTTGIIAFWELRRRELVGDKML